MAQKRKLPEAAQPDLRSVAHQVSLPSQAQVGLTRRSWLLAAWTALTPVAHALQAERQSEAPERPVPPSAASAFKLPAPATLHYDIRGRVSFLSYRASGSLRWWHDGSSYEARLRIEVFLLGAREQVSRGRINSAGLQPLRFVDQVSNERWVEFDYERAQVRFSEGSAPVSMPAGAQDHLSVLMQVGGMLAAAPLRYPPDSLLVQPAMGIYGPETWRILVSGEDKLRLAGTELAATKLKRQTSHSDELGVEVWLAPSLDWLPARIRLTQASGDYVDQQLRIQPTP